MEKREIEDLMEKYGFSLEETHISWVLIGRDVVYKIKKPVNFGFLDYSTLSKRLEFCKKEIELNKRLAQGMYLGLSAVVKTDEGLDIDKAGEVIEYAVRMKKIPQDRMMDVLIKHNAVKYEHIDKIAKIVAKFHLKAQTNPYISSFGSIEVNKQNTDENFQQTKDAVGDYITDFEYDAIKRYTNEFYENSADIFEKRIKEEKIRDCHGDMYSRNICIVSKEEIYIYDCIEFNERFRYSDVASDVAFMLMDLENYSRYDLADAFLKHYIEYARDESLSYILNFYKIYRAYVRGKIAYFQKLKKEANLYFDLAFGYLPDDFKPKLILMCGLTGAGKSNIAGLLSRKINAAVLSSDEIRKELAGMDIYQRDMSAFGEGIYSQKMTNRVYSELSIRAYEAVRNGKNVILDATFLKESQRNKIKDAMKRLGIEPKVVFVDVDDATALKHFEIRKKDKSVSDGRLEIYKKQKKLFEKPKNCINVDAKSMPDDIVRKIVQSLN